MEEEFWQRRWQENRIGFHQSEVNRFLQAHKDWFAQRLEGATFVPLCGKSQDMAWLREHVSPVLGVELSPLAIEAFFREQGLVARQTVRGAFRAYEASGIALLAGDYFALTADAAGPIGAVYDRAALIALPAPMRVRYAQHMATLLRPGTPVLLVAPFSPKGPLDGPPFAVSEDEVRALYGRDFQVCVLARHRDTPETRPELRDRGLPFSEENVYGLVRL
ncbi:MAG: thiopurine S-methyltransferase [Gammaproteobacteria bacterium]|nr:thiopurine S-methyltransferase [Gammaproteobacteria bacterium]